MNESDEIAAQRTKTKIKEKCDEIQSKLNKLRKEVDFDGIFVNRNNKIIIKYQQKEKTEIITEVLDTIVGIRYHQKVHYKFFTIKEIPKYLSEDEVMNDLIELNNLERAGLKINLINNPKFRNNMCEVSLPESQAHRLDKKDGKVKIEYRCCPIESNVRVIQCYNCCRFGHYATKMKTSNCRHETRCLKCGQSHKVNECTSDAHRCCNCGGEHSANYKGCEMYKEVKKRIQENQ